MSENADEPKAPGGRLVRWSVRSLLAIVAGLALLEVAVRVLDLAPPPPAGYPRGIYARDDAVGFRLTPGFEGAMVHPAGSTSIRLNAHGYRDVEFGPKAAGAFRILCLGDSFVFGHGVEVEHAYPQVLGGLLEATHPNVEVLNLGVPGYTTVTELQQLRADGPALAPDLVVLGLYVGNDLRGNLEELFGRPAARSGYQLRIAPDENRTWVSVRAFLAAHSDAWRTFEKRRKGRAQAERSESEERDALCALLDWDQSFSLAVVMRSPSDDARAAYARTFDALADMRAACDELDARLVVALLPAPQQYDARNWTTIRNQIVNGCGLSPDDFDLLRPQRELSAAAERLGIPCLDPLPTFRATMAAAPDELLYMDVHFDEDGHRLLAEELVVFLRTQGLIQ